MRVRLLILVLVAAGSLAGGAHASTDAGGESAASDFDHCGVSRSLAPSTDVAVVARPVQPFTIPSPHFVVHFANESLASYAGDVSDAAEYAYRVLVDTLQHLPPPPDAGAGGDDRVDIYIRAAEEEGGAYGTTIPDTDVGVPFSNSYSSWVEIIDTLGVARRATVTVHEVYHVVQLGYDRRESVSLLEMFSTWFEDRAYDAVNSHYVFLNQFFRRPDRGLFEQNYTNVPWAIFLAQRHGDGIMRETLLRCAQTPGPNPRGAFDGALQSSAGTTFLDEFIEFGTWNFFVSLRDDGAHYAEGAHYPAMRCQLRNDCYPLARYETDHRMSELAANYFLFDGDGHRAGLRVRVEPEPASTSYLTVIRFRGDKRERTVTRYDPGAAADSFLVDDWEHCDSVLAIYQIDRGLAKDNTVAVSARYEYEAPPLLPWILVLDRDGCRNPFDGDADEFTTRDGEEAPIAAALVAAGETVVVTDALDADLSRCRAVFVVGGFGADGVTLAPFDLATLGSYMDAGGDVYLESARLGAWVDSALTSGEPELPAFWSRFGCEFEAGRDTLNVASWSSVSGARAFVYDPGAPDYRVGSLRAVACDVLARDDQGRACASVRRVGESTRIVSTILLGGSTGLAGTTREAFVDDVLARFDADPVTQAPAAPLRLVASYPNPARDTADLFVESPSAGSASVTIYDVAGRRVSTVSVPLTSGANTIRVATPRVSGVYFVVVDAGGATARGRFLVLR